MFRTDGTTGPVHEARRSPNDGLEPPSQTLHLLAENRNAMSGHARSIPLVQLGPGGDYVRRIMADGDRLVVIQNTFDTHEDPPHTSAGARRRPRRRPERGLWSRLASWLGLVPAPEAARAATTASAAAIPSSTARAYRLRRGDDRLVRADNAPFDHRFGIDRLELSRAAIAAAMTPTPAAPPLPSPPAGPTRTPAAPPI